MKVVGHVGEGKGGRGFRLRLGIAEFSPVQGDESAFSLYFSFFFFSFSHSFSEPVIRRGTLDMFHRRK